MDGSNSRRVDTEFAGYDVIYALPEEIIQEHYDDSILDESLVFRSEKSLSSTTEPKSKIKDQDISTRGLGDAGTSYDISVNTIYANEFSASESNHYYKFSVASTTKLTGRNWNIPSTTNLDMALYKKSASTAQWNLVAFSQVQGTTEEQLSYIASTGNYMLEIAMTGTLDTSTYNVSVTTQATYDSQEADDNYWQAQNQTSFHQIVGTLDNNFDKDFIKFTNTQSEAVKYSIIGGDYTAQLRDSSGGLTYILTANSLANLTIPAGTWYWIISSPSQSVNTSTNYTFNQQKKNRVARYYISIR